MGLSNTAQAAISSALLDQFFPLGSQYSIAFEVFEFVPSSDVLAQTTFVAHPNSLEHATGSGIAPEVMCMNSVQTERFKSETEHRPRRFRAIAFSPERHAD